MEAVPFGEGMMLAGVLFCIGLIGVMVRRNLLFVLMSLDLMLNAAALAFVVAGARWGEPDGQVLVIFVLAVAAAESVLGLALILQLYRGLHTLDSDLASRMRG